MRTISAIALCLMLVFATTGCAASKIAVVDPARLFQESEPGKAGIEHLKQLEAAMQEQLKTAQGMIEKAPNDEPSAPVSRRPLLVTSRSSMPSSRRLCSRSTA